MENANAAEARLLLDFANPHGEPVSLGPYSFLRFEGETLLGGPSGEVVAKHSDQRWVLARGGSFSRLECNTRVLVHFCAANHSQSRKLGPFDSFSSIDGVAYADRSLIAFCDRQLQDWYSLDIGSHWRAMVVEPA